MLKGSDIALAVVKIDRSSQDFDEKTLEELELPGIDYVDAEDLQNLSKSIFRVTGYPIQVYDQ